WKFKKYGECGSPVSELFPHVAGCVDDVCFVHSLHGTNPAHGGATLKLHTGSDNFVRPSMGAWVAYGLGTDNQNLPAFVTICPTLAHGGVNNWGSAFLPAACQGVPIGNASIPVDQAKVRYINPKQPADIQRRQLGLLTDLKARGLLHDTLVLWGGEFGRTPTVEGNADGRDHNPEGFTVWLAGGGVKPGFRYGATDDYGWFAANDKVHIHDLHATLL